MDRITKSLLKEFVAENDLESLPEDTAFEHFSGYLTTSSHYSESFSSDDIAVGAGGDCGVDCISIIVNGSLVTEPEEIQDLAETNGYLDVHFIFVQAERSSSFESAKIGQFGFGVTDFFSEEPSLPQNDSVQLFSRITNEIFLRSGRFKKGNPRCDLYYVTTGRWSDDANLVARKGTIVEDLQDLNIFRNVTFECIGADGIQQLYRDSKNTITTEISFSQRTVIPEMPGVEQAYIGLLPSSEFLKLVENANEEILSSIFFDNVRDWQEWNPVNAEMQQTLQDDEEKVYFPLLNNGVTVVAKRIQPTGNRFSLEDYQIVNGCQTSYVLYETRATLSDQVMIPVRLIATQDESIKNSIIKATNRQTPVTEEQLFALSDFPKKLEAYLPSFDGRKKLYYERRSRQYNSIEGIEKVRVINMTALVRAYAAIFLELPHRTTRNYKALLRTVGTDIFNVQHRLEPYYIAAYAHYKLEYLFRSQALASELKAARYHILLGFRLLADGSALPRFNSHEMRRYCQKLMEILWDDVRCRDVFQASADMVRQVAAGNMHRDNIRTEPFTAQFIIAINAS
jgi:hypothetical protein